MQGYKFESETFKQLIGGSTASYACSMQGYKNENVTYYRAIAELADGDIFIYNENVSGPVSARYGNDNYFRPIFLDKCGRPIVPFWI